MNGSTAIAVAGGAFGKQHQHIAFRQPLGDGVARRAGFAAPRAGDENGALQPRQGAEETAKSLTSDLATKESGATAEKITISSQLE